MLPALLFCSEDVLPFSQLEKVRGAVIWNRDGHYRFIPAGRVFCAVNMFRRLNLLHGPDSPALKGIPWTMTEEYKPHE